MWKTISEVLPTKSNLFKREITDNYLCLICELVEETSCHDVWSCASTQDVQVDSLRSLQKWQYSDISLYKLCEKMVIRLHKNEPEGAACVLRKIQFRMNNFFFTGISTIQDLFYKKQRKNWRAFNKHQRKSEPHIITTHSIITSTRWRKPNYNSYKVN